MEAFAFPTAASEPQEHVSSTYVLPALLLLGLSGGDNTSDSPFPKYSFALASQGNATASQPAKRIKEGNESEVWKKTGAGGGS
jgi:hypothetical protein